MALDEKDGGGPRIVFQGEGGERQELPAQETSTFGVVDGTENENDPTSEYFWPRLSGPMFTPLSVFLPSGEDAVDVEEGEDEQAEESGGTC